MKLNQSKIESPHKSNQMAQITLKNLAKQKSTELAIQIKQNGHCKKSSKIKNCPHKSSSYKPPENHQNACKMIQCWTVDL